MTLWDSDYNANLKEKMNLFVTPFLIRSGNQMQTKFSALIPKLLAEKSKNDDHDNIYFWHSFFLLKPEFHVLQTALFSNYSIDSLRFLISKCLETIAEPSKDKVHQMKKVNASYLLVQIFESLWPRIRQGTFGVDAINILCGLQNSKQFFDKLFSSILNQNQPETVLVLISLLVATRDIETNALTDFFITKCDQIVSYCFQASDLHILLFSLLLQLERPSGAFIEAFRDTNKHYPEKFRPLVANLLARCTQFYICCRPMQQTLFKKQSKPTCATIGLFSPSDFELPAFFQLFEPFIDAAALNFFELCISGVDTTTASAAISLFTHIETSPTTLHSGDRLYLFLISFAFMFAKYPQIAAQEFDYKQCKSCFNSGVTACVERSIGAMVCECICFLMNLKSLLPQLLNIIGRIIYSIILIFNTFRGTHQVDWKNLFTSLFAAVDKSPDSTEFNTFVVCLIALCSTFRTALFKRDDGYIELLRALSQNTRPGYCECTPTDAFERSDDFIKKCQKHVYDLTSLCAAITPDMTDEQLYEFAQSLKVNIVPSSEFKQLEPLTEQPRFTQFLRVYERTHCENTQAFLHYASQHN